MFVEWVLLLFVALGPWFAVWILGDRRLFRASLPGGILMALLCTLMDEIGVKAGLWYYPLDAFRVVETHHLFNLFSFSAEATLISQYALSRQERLPRWIGGFAVANTLMECVITRHTNLVKYLAWHPLLSTPVYLVLFGLMAGFTRWLHHEAATGPLGPGK